MFGLPEKLWPTNNSGVPLVRSTPEGCSLPFSLELEPSSQLNLPLTEEGAVGTGNGPEGSVSGQALRNARWTPGSTPGVKSGIHKGDLRTIEQVETFGQQLQLGTLSDIEPA